MRRGTKKCSSLTSRINSVGGPDGKAVFMLATEFRGSDKVKEVARPELGKW